ncbi:MAG: asparaginase [Bacillota bacterium]|jgi:L-asparaginase II
MDNVLVQVTRGSIVESWHRGHIAVVDADGNLKYSFGDPNIETFIRSAAKPIQVLPLVESGAARHFSFTEQEIAIMCGSHSGEPHHIKTVMSIFDKIGLPVTALQCGVHSPFHKPSAKALAEAGEKPTVLHNNCSGKHAAMLAMCVFKGWPHENYLDISHPVQQLNLQTISNLSGIKPEQIHVGVDGCSVPVFGMPLSAMARIFARFVNPFGLPDYRQDSCHYVTNAMLQHPDMVAGTGRICTELMENTPGTVLAKAGAEAVYCMALVKEGLGIALKIEDGSNRPLSPVVIEVLKQLGMLSAEALSHLEKMHKPAVTNLRKIIVGKIKPAFTLLKH